MEYLIDYWNKKQEEKRSNNLLASIHKDVIAQLERPHMDDDEMKEIEPGQNLGIINFLQNK